VADDTGKSTNTFKFPAPRMPGDYSVRFFPSLCGYNHVSKSNILRIINKDKLHIEKILVDNTARVKSIKVTWDIHSVDVNSCDYIALYKQEALNNYYETFQYVDIKSDYLIFEAPKEIGCYNLRYHSASQSKYLDISRSDVIQISNTDLVSTVYSNGIVTVSWDIHSQPQTNWDWIGIFEEGASNTSYVMFKYVEVNTSSTTFHPLPTGNKYEARYFSSKLGKYCDFRKSDIFTT